jgi:DNA polymerase-3 subunit delta'
VSFDGIKGQDRAVSFLKGSISGGRIAHAYIFYGARGVGKKLSALEFAKAVNCASPGERPCRLCPSCAKIGSSSHPDVSVITPAAGSQSLGIDGIRSLISDISLKPYEARKKIYIIDEADSLTEEASNALLKTLEEPPTDSVIILIAEKLQHILPTIISRSQTVRFFALAAETVERILVKDRGLEAGAAGVLSRLSSGSMAAALRYADGKFFEKRSVIIRSLRERSIFDIDLDRAAKPDLKAYLDIMLAWYRDLLVAKASSGAVDAVNADMKGEISEESARISFGDLDRIIKSIIMTGAFLDQNANPKLAMAALGVEISK